MAKQSGGMPKIDEDFMRELISQGVPSKEDNKPNDAPHTNCLLYTSPSPRDS